MHQRQSRACVISSGVYNSNCIVHARALAWVLHKMSTHMCDAIAAVYHNPFYEGEADSAHQIDRQLVICVRPELIWSFMVGFTMHLMGARLQ